MNKKHIAIIAAFTVMSSYSCSNEKVETSNNVKEKVVGGTATIKIDIFGKKGCKSTEPTIELVKNTIAQMDVSCDLSIMLLKSHSRAIELKVIGSPTIRVNGVDIDPAAGQVQKYGLT